MAYREEHLSAFADLPEEIWEAHRRVAAAVNAEA
jgi:phosphoenolpyruvate carboxykinase (GTP)